MLCVHKDKLSDWLRSDVKRKSTHVYIAEELILWISLFGTRSTRANKHDICYYVIVSLPKLKNGHRHRRVSSSLSLLFLLSSSSNMHRGITICSSMSCSCRSLNWFTPRPPPPRTSWLCSHEGSWNLAVDSAIPVHSGSDVKNYRVIVVAVNIAVEIERVVGTVADDI